MKRILKYSLSAATMVACALIYSSCSDWTEQESLDIHTPTIEEQNPELYAQYIESLNEYKASEHLVMIASVNNLPTLPSARNQHLTNLPDSIDYICLNNILEVNEVNVAEMEDVRKKGTKVLGLADFDAIAASWKAILDKEKEEAANAEGDEEVTVDDATRFIEYCKAETAKLIAAANDLGVDGIEMNYTGFDLKALVGEEEIAAESARQGAFFDAVVSWKAANTDKLLIFKGAPQNVMQKDLLTDCKYIIINAHGAKNQSEMSYLVWMASIDGVPTDRFVMGVTTPYVIADGSFNGLLIDGSSAILTAAQWAVPGEATYVKAGISVDAAEQDYFNAAYVYPNIREAINIMNPTVK